MVLVNRQVLSSGCGNNPDPQSILASEGFVKAKYAICADNLGRVNASDQRSNNTFASGETWAHFWIELLKLLDRNLAYYNS